MEPDSSTVDSDKGTKRNAVAQIPPLARYPPILKSVLVSGESRRDCIAGASLYTPARRWTVVAHKALTHWLRRGGSWMLSSASDWTPAIEGFVWEMAARRWQQHLGPFRVLGICERRQKWRRAMCGFLLYTESGYVFVKVLANQSAAAREFLALEHVHDKLKLVRSPEPILLDEQELWSGVIMSGLPATPHSPAPTNLAKCICDEIVSVAETFMVRPADVPKEWQPMHGDFTPWNLRCTSEHPLPYLIDWTDLSWGPPHADWTYYQVSARTLGLTSKTNLDREAARFWEQRLKGQEQGRQVQRMLAVLRMK